MVVLVSHITYSSGKYERNFMHQVALAECVLQFAVDGCFKSAIEGFELF
ncbi:MAG: hypothetical protein QXW32_07650 [Nitrososphaerales archaeon]